MNLGNEITITISGPAASGKSILAWDIYCTLQAHGLNVRIDMEDEDSPKSLGSNFWKKLSSIRGTRVNIKQVRTLRTEHV